MTSRQRIDDRQPREECFNLPLPDSGGSLFLSRLAPPDWAARTVRRTVLYVHGATFPSALSIAHRFDGRSWRDVLVDAGYAVWGLDFLGFGGSDRPAAMTDSSAVAPFCRAGEAARQLAAAITFITARGDGDRVSLIAHSWGSMPSGLVAAQSPERVDRLVLFAPIARRADVAADMSQALPPCRLVSLADQWRRFIEDVPAGEAGGMLPHHFTRWGEAYLDSDETSRSRDPASVCVPAGPAADIAAAWSGTLAYDPADIRAPTLIVRGAWDRVTSEADGRWLHDALRRAVARRLVSVPRATHLAHLEETRFELYRQVDDFLAAAAPS
jgi:pimeloyl-ACP methyl ester carboxylesterase